MKTLISISFLLLIISGCAQKKPEMKCYNHVYKTTTDKVIDNESGDSNKNKTIVSSTTTETKHCFKTPKEKTSNYDIIRYSTAIITLLL